MSSGVIRLTGLEAVGRHGALEYERELGQRFSVDLELLIEWPERDELSDTVNYSTIAAEALALVTGEPVILIETLASRIADQVLSHERVLRVSVTVNKPDAPIPAKFRNVSATVTREQAR